MNPVEPISATTSSQLRFALIEELSESLDDLRPLPDGHPRPRTFVERPPGSLDRHGHLLWSTVDDSSDQLLIGRIDDVDRAESVVAQPLTVDEALVFPHRTRC